MPAKSACKSPSARILACLLSVTLVVSLCPLQGWSEEPVTDPEPDQLTEVVPLADEPETAQLTKAVPFTSEPGPSETAKKADTPETAKVVFVISDEPTATWPDSTTDDRVIEVPVGESLGSLVPPTPISSDDSLVFEGWQTEDFETIDEDALRKRTIEGDAILYATFSSQPAGSEQRAEPVEQIASGTFGTCQWDIWGTSTSGTLTIYAGTLGSGRPDWLSYADKITYAVINSGVKMGSDTYGLFDGCSKVKTIRGLEALDVSQATRLSSMFYNCSSLTSLDLSSWDVSRVKSMNSVFRSCFGLTSVGDLSAWNTSNVTDMAGMFHRCSSLVSLNLSTWKTAKVTDMNGMFNGCSSLTSVGDLSGWSMSMVNNIGSMFNGCKSLTSVGNLSKWNVSRVTNMDSTFYYCRALSALDLSEWDVSSVSTMDRMFGMCSSLSSLNLASWNMSKVSSMTTMFSGCDSLKTIPASFSFGATPEADRTGVFDVVDSGNIVVTTYDGANTDVENYDWPADGRALKGTSLTGTVNVSGDASSVEQTLTASAEPDNACRNAQQVFTWYRGTSATDPTPTQIASGASYTTTNADAGKYIICKMTDGLGAYTGEILKAVGPVKRTFSGTANLEGTAKVGSTLTANVNNPSSGQVSFAYRWYRSSTGTDAGELISGEMSNSYELKDADKGMFVSCEVSVADTAAWTGSIRSGWSARVLKDFTGSVSIDGSMLTDSTLTAKVSDSNAGGEALSYRWYRSDSNSGDGTLISDATSSTYRQTDADRNQYLSCVVSVANTTAWTGSIRSGWKGPSLTTFTAGVRLSGTAVVGQPLKANVTTPNASSYSYKWQRADKGTVNWVDIPNATAGTYELGQDDFGKIVHCVVAASVEGYTGEVVSDATAAIQGELDGKVTVSGNLYANQELTASTEGLSEGATAAYKWYTATDATGASKTQIAGATADKLDLSQIAQTQVVGKYIVCEVFDSSNAYVNTLTSSAVGPIGIAWGTSGPKAGGCIWTIDAAGAMVIAPATNGQGSLGSLAANSVPWWSFAAQVKSARVASGVKAGAGLTGMFSACSQMTTVDLSGLDASEATDLSSMFTGCRALTTVKGLDALKAAKPTNLGSMFSGCSSLTSLDLSGLAAGTATDLSAMFWGCSQLSDLKLPAGFVGEKCSTVVNMFYGCNALATIPPEFGFGSNKSIQTDGCFKATGSTPLDTTYLGDDLNVVTYDWQGSNRSLIVWKLSGEATIAGGDDPIADNELTALVTFTGPAAGLEEGATYQWYTANSADDANPQPIDKATNATYSPCKADVGKFLVCLVSAPSDSGAQGTLRVATSKAVRAPQVWATVPSRTQVYVDSEGHASVPTTSAYALGALDSEGKATEGDIQLVGVTLTLGDSTFPGGSWTLGTPGDDKTKASVFIENKAFATPGTLCTVEGAPAIAPGSKLPLEWEASFQNNSIGPELGKLLAAADGEGAHYGEVEFKVAWKPRA